MKVLAIGGTQGPSCRVNPNSMPSFTVRRAGAMIVLLLAAPFVAALCQYSVTHTFNLWARHSLLLFACALSSSPENLTTLQCKFSASHRTVCMLAAVRRSQVSSPTTHKTNDAPTSATGAGCKASHRQQTPHIGGRQGLLSQGLMSVSSRRRRRRFGEMPRRE